MESWILFSSMFPLIVLDGALGQANARVEIVAVAVLAARYQSSLRLPISKTCKFISHRKVLLILDYSAWIVRVNSRANCHNYVKLFWVMTVVCLE